MKRALAVAVLCLAVAVIPPAVGAARKEKLSAEQKAALAKLKGPLAKAVGEEPLTVLELAGILDVRRSAWPEKVEIHPEAARDVLESLRETLVEQIRTRYPEFDKPPEEEPPPLILKYYDVSDIVFSPPNYIVPVIGLGGAITTPSSGAQVSLADDDEEECLMPGVASEELIDLIECRIASECDEGSIRYTSGQLVVRKPEATHKKLEKLFAMLREQFGYAITMEVKFLRIDRTFYREFLKKHGALVPGHIKPEIAAELVNNAGKDRPVEIVTDHEITAYEGQSVVLREGRQVSLVTDYEISTAGVIPVMNSVIQNINEGLIVGLSPIITGDRKSVQLTVKGSYLKLEEPVKEMETKDGPIQQPHIKITRLRTTFRIPDRQVAIVGGVFTGPDATGDPMLLIVKPIIGRTSK